MPLYDWACQECGMHVTTIKKVDERNEIPTKEDDSRISQPCKGATNGHRFERIIKGGNFKLIGGCWARDNYR